MFKLFAKIKQNKTAHDEAKVDYMARALMMPVDSFAESLVSFDFFNQEPDVQEEMIKRLSNKYKAPIEQVKNRIGEVYALRPFLFDD